MMQSYPSGSTRLSSVVVLAATGAYLAMPVDEVGVAIAIALGCYTVWCGSSKSVMTGSAFLGQVLRCWRATSAAQCEPPRGIGARRRS